MIIVERGMSNGALTRALKSMFQARKEVFVDLLKWDLPVLEGRFECDQFDNEHAIYIIVTDEDGAHRASARLLETVRPHILSDLYPDLCAAGVPRGPGTFEITRFCLDRNQHAAKRREARNILVSALVSIALERGIELYTGVAEMGWLQQVLAFGWDCRPLGIPRQFGGALIGALSIAITPQTPQMLAQNGIWTADVAPSFAQAA